MFVPYWLVFLTVAVFVAVVGWLWAALRALLEVEEILSAERFERDLGDDE